MAESQQFGIGNSATSGYATWNPDVLEIFEMAAGRAGLDMDGGVGRSGYGLRQFRRDLNAFSQEMANRGLDFGIFETITVQLTSPQYQYLLPPDTLDLLDGYIRINANQAQSQNDFKITRFSQMQYDRIPNKLVPGRPLNFLLQRYTSTITLVLWPPPDTSQPYTFYSTRIRRIQDAGAYTNQVDYAYRWLPLIIDGMAYYIALRTPSLIDRLDMLKAKFEEQYQITKRADIDRSRFRIVPRSNLRNGW